jgi:hypothetical protein
VQHKEEQIKRTITVEQLKELLEFCWVKSLFLIYLSFVIIIQLFPIIINRRECALDSPIKYSFQQYILDLCVDLTKWFQYRSLNSLKSLLSKHSRNRLHTIKVNPQPTSSLPFGVDVLVCVCVANKITSAIIQKKNLFFRNNRSYFIPQQTDFQQDANQIGNSSTSIQNVLVWFGSGFVSHVYLQEVID